jgi:RNA polymerase sigma-B factor
MPELIAPDLKTDSLLLLKDYQENPSSRLRNQIVEMNFGLVRREAYHWVGQCQESYEDLVQVGCLGLIRAIERFDLSRGYAFSSFALPYIRGEIQHYLRDKSPTVRIPRRWQALQRQTITTIRQLQHDLHRHPTDAEIAAALEIDMIEWQEVKVSLKNRGSLISLDAPIADDDLGSVSLGDMMPDHQYRSFQLAQEDQIRIQQALQQVEKLTRQVLEFVFLHDLTQKETAERLGISSVTVSRRVKKGIEALQVLLAGSDH